MTPGFSSTAGRTGRNRTCRTCAAGWPLAASHDFSPHPAAEAVSLPMQDYLDDAVKAVVPHQFDTVLEALHGADRERATPGDTTGRSDVASAHPLGARVE